MHPDRSGSTNADPLAALRGPAPPTFRERARGLIDRIPHDARPWAVALLVTVVVAGVAILFTGQWWIDPVTSLVIVAIIGWGTWGLLKDSVKMGLHAVPDTIDEAEVRGYLEGLPGVAAVHDLHIWPMSTTETALTAHMVMPEGPPGDAFLHDLAHELEHRFHIGHATVQVERGVDDCQLGHAHG